MQGGGGEGLRTQNSFIRTGFAPGSNYLLFIYHFWKKKYPPPFRTSSTDKSFPHHIPSLELCIPKSAVFEMWSNHKTRMFSRLFHSHTIHLIALLGLFQKPKWQIFLSFQLLQLIPTLWGTPFERSLSVYAIIGSTLSPGPNVTLAQASLKPQKRLNFPVQVHAFWLASCGYVLVPGSFDAMRSH